MWLYREEDLAQVRPMLIQAAWQEHVWDYSVWDITLVFRPYRERTLLIDRHGWLIYPELGALPPSAPLTVLLTAWSRELEERFFAPALEWGEVERLFPRYGHATLTDIDTGLTFSVQRRAGSRHADVQPLTAMDTKIMKSIFGEWTWLRRAVVVTLPDGTRIAASMNGMPHGAGAIQDNEFDGHFCLHFLGSSTHAGRSIDMGHQMMVRKATGNFLGWYSTLGPREAAEVHLNALKNKDTWILSQTMTAYNGHRWRFVLERLDNVIINHVGEGPQVSAHLEFFLKDGRKMVQTVTLNMFADIPREGPSYWLVEHDWLEVLLELVAEVR
jgi:hypothetical protein